MKPTRDVLAFFAFVSFFPQLVAGPIERARRLLPQFQSRREFDYGQAVDGLRQILWGLFKKIVIADNCALMVDQLFGQPEAFSGGFLLLGGVFFAFQIYCDFSGYSDIAIGTARLFGIRLMRNFAFPYFSRDIAEFWRRWHISLTTWFRDYLYIPLGGSRGSRGATIRNVFIIFVVSGLWHGANWTFVAWGVLNALYFLPLMLTKRNRRYTGPIAQGRALPGLRELTQMLGTFTLTVIAWIFFRAESLVHADHYLRQMLRNMDESSRHMLNERWGLTLLFIGVLLLAEWLQREKQHALEFSPRGLPRAIRWLIYYALIAAIFAYGGTQQQFIYFQF